MSIYASDPNPIAVTVGTQLVTGKGYLTGALLNGGSAAGVLTLYDGTSTGGTVLAVMNAAIGASYGHEFHFPPRFSVGLFAVLSGTGSVANVYSRPM